MLNGTSGDSPLERQLEELRHTLAALVQERENRTDHLVRQLAQIEDEYRSKERGIKKAIEGLEEATGYTDHAQGAEGGGAAAGKPIRTQDAIERVMSASPGANFTAKDLVKLVRQAGASFNSTNPERAIVSSVYAVINKYQKKGMGEPRKADWCTDLGLV